MAPKLDDLLTDDRLARLFTTDGRDCALQLWVLQIKCGQSTENRVVYGRLLPYSHSSNSWSFSNNDDFHAFGQAKAKVTRLNLYVKSDRCAELIRLLSGGRSISVASEELGLRLPDKLRVQFGETSLGTGNQIYRPVAYLLNRDAHDWRSTSSPHGAAGAFSASIVQANKKALFNLGEVYETALTAMVIKHLNADTGLDFGGADITRFGDLELLVFPTLDDSEQSLLSVSWVDSPCALVARLNPVQVPHFSGFQFRLSIANDGQIVYSGLATAVRDEAGEFVCEFVLSDQLRERTDSTELEIFGFHGDHSSGGLLCCRWRVGYVRELNFQGHLVNHGGSQVKFDWLEKTVRPSVSARAKAALTINRGDLGFGNSIGGRKVDPWVPVNRDLVSLFARLHPPKSEGQFLLRWGNEDPESRLQFIEWFKALLAKYQQHQIVIFDPYFEDAGLGLVLLCAAQNANYIVFRSLPKRPSKEKEAAPNEFEEAISSGIDNLLKNCEHNRHLLRRLKLRIYGLKEGRLHDRYILIIGADSLPVAGFNLSNSFQKAAENYPLLITPIPADILFKVEKYMSELVEEAENTKPKDEIENPSIRVLFDSMESPTMGKNYEPLNFLNNNHAGDVLSAWVGEQSLQGLSGDSLKERMRVLDLLKDGALALSETTGLHNCLRQKAGDFTDFVAAWEVIGEVLAHSHIEEYRLRELEPEPERGFLEFLARFLEASFSRTHDEFGKEVTVMDARFFQMPVEKLLHSSYHPHHLFHATKYTVLTWMEYYTIKFLWWYAPDALLSIAEAQIASVPMEPQGTNTVRLSLLSQIFSEISLTVQFGANAGQRDRLVQSSSGLMQWMGLNAIKTQLGEPGGLAAVLQLIAAFGYPERVRALGWMVHHAAMDSNKEEIFKDLVAALHKVLPGTITGEELRHLVDSMRGHMGQLAWAEPWLFRDVVFPLLQSERVSTEESCDIWMRELVSMLEPRSNNQSRLFVRAREGQTTNIASFLFAYSNPKQREVSLKMMADILKRQRRILQQPLASTSGWTTWNDALRVSLWILAFGRWSEFYLHERGATDQKLEQLSRDARGLTMIRPIEEWQSERGGKQDELVAFLDQVEGLLNADG
ncbi:hypothetical protein AN401_12000 [Zobellella denitrificans]|uniref:Uncharacterized protein n=1 Tax=Zobellella denitrificans TaxID=347534 RepID=A0A291HV21_9GAMM|nr:VPA1262 family protein [Zobellella denitrificans]ATG75921.1 hypothetical protein AN401_12000 [Zobellella denitrificans]